MAKKDDQDTGKLDLQRDNDADGGRSRDRLRADEGEPPLPPDPVQFKTRRDVSLLVVAMEKRADDLDKLAKKNTEEGYPKEARTMAADSAQIKHSILPSIRDQRELPLATQEEVQGAIANYLLGTLRRARQTKMTDEILVEEIAKRVGPVLEQCALSGYSAGYSARLHEPGLIAVQAIERVREQRSE